LVSKSISFREGSHVTETRPPQSCDRIVLSEARNCG
jgi:hypothetical protein